MDSFGKPSEHEQEYFVRQEFKRRKQEMEAQKAKLAAEEQANAKELHHMKCPKCGMDLAEMSFQGVSIDKCTSCEGIWLDPGELDTLLDHQEKGGVRKILRVFGLKAD